MLRVKRVYEPRSAEDGFRVLVDRIWPRGVTKADAAIDLWLKDVAPSAELRRWFGHDPQKWTELRRRYAEELDARIGAIEMLRRKMDEGDVTLVYAARDREHNNAVALKEYLAR